MEIRKIKKYIHNLLLLGLLSSCSFKSIVIPNATYFVADRIGDKYNFYYNQEKEFKRGLDNIFRTSISDLKGINKHLKGIEINKYKLDIHLDVYTDLYFKVAKQVNIIFAKSLSEFNPKQQKNFWEKVLDENEIILNRSKKDKTREISKRFEFFFGKLEEKQTKLIKKNINVFQRINRTRLNNRLISQKNMTKIFKYDDVKKRNREFVDLFDKNLADREPSSNLLPIAKFCSQFFLTLNNKQISHFKEKQNLVTDWIDGFIDYYSKN